MSFQHAHPARNPSGPDDARAEREQRPKPGPMLQRQSTQPAAGGPDSGNVPPIVDEVLRSPGHPLDPASRAAMEPRFGYNFSQVRVHSDSQAAESAASVNAEAYTVGSNIVLGATHAAPGNPSHRSLLAHELAHVVQQGGKSGGTRPSISSAGEQEANLASAAVMAGRDVRVSPIAAAGLQRQTQGNNQANAGGTQPPNQSQTAATPYILSPDYVSFGLRADNPRQAVAIFGQTPVANALVKWLADHHVQYNVRFLARRRDLPSGKGDAGADGTYAREANGFTVYVLGSLLLWQNGGWTDDRTDRDPGAMAKTLFHELLHVWFVNSGRPGTGHSANVAPPSIGPSGGVNYDEPNYNAEFLAKLKQFDAEVAAQRQQQAPPQPAPHP